MVKTISAERVKQKKIAAARSWQNLANAYYRRATELANTVNVGNGAKIIAVKGNYGNVNLRIVNSNNTNRVRAHMEVHFNKNNDNKPPYVYLASGRTEPAYRPPQPGQTGRKYDYGTIIRALASQIAENVGSHKTMQISINAESLLPSRTMLPISGRIMKKIGAKILGGHSGSGATLKISYKKFPSVAKAVLKSKKVRIPILPPNVNYSNQIQKLQNEAVREYSRNNVNTRVLPLVELHGYINKKLNNMGFTQLKSKINVMKRRIPINHKHATLKALLNYYTNTLKKFEKERAVAVSKLKMRLAKKITKPKSRSKTVTVPHTNKSRKIQMIDTARAYVASNANLRKNAPNLDRRLEQLRYQVMLNKNNHTINNNKWSRVAVNNDNNRHIMVSGVVEKNNTNKNKWNRGDVNFENFTPNGRNFGGYQIYPRNYFS